MLKYDSLKLIVNTKFYRV